MNDIHLPQESRVVEYKQQATDLRKIAQTVVAFANGIGGELMVGVEDKTRAIVGLDSKTIDDLLERLPLSLADTILPAVTPLIYTQTIGDKEVLIIKVFQGMQKPYFIAKEGLNQGIFVRVGAHTRRAEGALLEELLLKQQRLEYDEAPVTRCPLAKLNLSLLPKGLRAEKMLFSLDILHRDQFSGEVAPTRGGVLMLHPHPEQFVPEAEVIISKMRGTEGRETVESHIIQGPIPHQAEACIELLSSWLGIEPRLRGAAYRPTQHKLPTAAIREVVLNALFHRQYSIAGAIKIALYRDRLEIFSPGHFAGPFIAESLGDGTSYIRNRVICTIARRLFLVEKRGTGIALIRSSMRDEGLREPEFIEGPNWFKVILSLEKEAAKEPTLTENVTYPPDGTGLKARILELIKRKKEVSSSDLSQELNVSKATVTSQLNILRSEGRVKRIGAGPMTRYQLGGASF
jgi:predicted HTH transcriptional regulator